jgi:hypothetical protein
VFVIVAVNTEVFPVGPVGRIIQVISIFVVDGQEMPRLFIVLSATFGADKPVYFEGALPIITLRRRGFLQFLKRFINGLIVSCLLRRSLMMNSVRSVLHGKACPLCPPSPTPSPIKGEGSCYFNCLSVASSS